MKDAGTDRTHNIIRRFVRSPRYGIGLVILVSVPRLRISVRLSNRLELHGKRNRRCARNGKRGGTARPLASQARKKPTTTSNANGQVAINSCERRRASERSTSTLPKGRGQRGRWRGKRSRIRLRRISVNLVARRVQTAPY